MHNNDNIIQVELMDKEDALALLKIRVLFSESLEANIRALVQALGYIPLAITQAAMYISTKAAKMTISTYLRLFRASEANQVNLLNNEGARDLQRDYSIQHVIITIQQISFKQIWKTRPTATNLLALISMFDRQEIPKYLLNSNIDQLQFGDVMTPLISFSLIRVQIEKQSFEMHKLV